MPRTRTRTRAPARLAHDVTELIGFRLFRLTNTLGAAAEAEYIARHGLRLAEWRCLSIVARRGPCSASDICAVTHIDKAWVSRVTAQLLARELVAAQADANDARRTLFVATAAGLSTARAVLAAAERRHRRLFEGLPQPDREAFERVLSELQARADALLAHATAGSGKRPKPEL